MKKNMLFSCAILATSIYSYAMEKNSILATLETIKQSPTLNETAPWQELLWIDKEILASKNNEEKIAMACGAILRGNLLSVGNPKHKTTVDTLVIKICNQLSKTEQEKLKETMFGLAEEYIDQQELNNDNIAATMARAIINSKNLSPRDEQEQILTIELKSIEQKLPELRKKQKTLKLQEQANSPYPIDHLKNRQALIERQLILFEENKKLMQKKLEAIRQEIELMSFAFVYLKARSTLLIKAYEEKKTNEREQKIKENCEKNELFHKF